MKNSTNFTGGTPLQRATIFFENKWLEQFDKGFLSELENTKLDHSLQSPDSRKVAYQIAKAYSNVVFVLHKIAYLQSQVKQTSDMFLWVCLFRDSNELLIDAVNDFLNSNDKITPTNRQKPIIFGTLSRKSGYFEIDWNENILGKLNFPKMAIPLKRRGLDDATKFKSCISSIKSYLAKTGLEIRGINELVESLENDVIESCESFDLDYSTVEIDKDFSKWFFDRFF